MPQQILPIFLDGVQEINELLSYQKRDGSVYYFHGAFPIFSHSEDDNKSFRLIYSQLIDNGLCRNTEIQKVFPVSKVSVCRSLVIFRRDGSSGFFQTPKVRGAAVLTEDVLAQAQELLNEGESRLDTATELGLKKDTLAKAIQCGKLYEPVKKKHSHKSSPRKERPKQ